MRFFLFQSPRKNPQDKKQEEKIIYTHEREHDTNEGSEFLDDAIRMKEQPLMRTELSIGAGYPEGLL